MPQEQKTLVVVFLVGVGLLLVWVNLCALWFSESVANSSVLVLNGTSPTDSVEGVSSRGFSGRPFRSRTSRKTTSTFPRSVSVPLEPERNSCSFWAVVTTIFEPSDAILQMAAMPGTCLVIVADKKTPFAAFNKVNPSLGSVLVKFLSVEEQDSMGRQGIALVEALPWNHYGRKTLGYLYAIAQGAKEIWDFDDDNSFATGSPRDLPVKWRTVTNSDVINPYPFFLNDTSTDCKDSVPWPRGFPLSKLVNQTPPVVYPRVGAPDFGVVQSLADHDPDMDAIFRLTRPLPLNFVHPSPGIALTTRSLSPYNAQASLHTALWGLLLPITVHGRVSDIWRSYWAQRLMWHTGQRIGFAHLGVRQIRNAHGYLGDFESELPLYRQAPALVDFLQTWSPTSTSIPHAMIELYTRLFERGFIEEADLDVMERWIVSLRQVGYEFPPMVLEPKKPSLGVTRNITISIILMTRNDMDLLPTWVFFHGQMYGFENLYIFDGSDSPEQRRFLAMVVTKWGVKVRHSEGNLNSASQEISAWMVEFKGQCLWSVKLDTDEFLALANPGLTPQQRLATFKDCPSGTQCRFQHVWNVYPVRETNVSSLAWDQAKLASAGNYKQIYHCPTFKRGQFNLGSHATKSLTATNEGIVHYHYRAYEDLVASAHKAVVQHGYLSGKETPDEARSVLAKFPHKPKCGGNSCHKVWILQADLENHAKAKDKYYRQFGVGSNQSDTSLTLVGSSGGTSWNNISDFRDLLLEVTRLHE